MRAQSICKLLERVGRRKGIQRNFLTYWSLFLAARARCLSSALFHFTMREVMVRKLLTRMRVETTSKGPDQTTERKTPWESKYGCLAKLFQCLWRYVFNLSAKYTPKSTEKKMPICTLLRFLLTTANTSSTTWNRIRPISHGSVQSTAWTNARIGSKKPPPPPAVSDVAWLHCFRSSSVRPSTIDAIWSMLDAKDAATSIFKSSPNELKRSSRFWSPSLFQSELAVVTHRCHITRTQSERKDPEHKYIPNTHSSTIALLQTSWHNLAPTASLLH